MTPSNALIGRLRNTTTWTEAERALAPMPYQDIVDHYGRTLLLARTQARVLDQAELAREQHDADVEQRRRVEASIRDAPIHAVWATEARLEAALARIVALEAQVTTLNTQVVGPGGLLDMVREIRMARVSGQPWQQIIGGQAPVFPPLNNNNTAIPSVSVPQIRHSH